ncbi:MAG TPA: HAMP domain-containing histidine kinase, partial [bacterium]|nr:HAMP domain-containing histidine kinase [bacterium]
LALWRMDSWLAPQLARESLRPPSDYRAYPAASNAWTRGFSKIAPNEVLVQSPLLGVESPLFPLHFEIGPDGVRSPQAPDGNERDFAEANGISGELLDRACQQLRRIEQTLPVAEFRAKVHRALSQLPLLGCNVRNLGAAASPSQVGGAARYVQQSVAELDNRQRQFLNNVASDVDVANPGSRLASGNEKVGPMVPVWIDGDEDALVFARRVQSADGERLQAVLVDWQRLQQELVALVSDLLAAGTARLVRCESPTPAEQPAMLASVPARLVGTVREPVGGSELPVSAVLWTTWGVTLLGLLALGFTLRAAIGFGERRARFASAVTHELRTPLTTFRMYSEMLAEGVVTDPEARREYLQTLQRESDRLARVVENVLAWSRLEEGRFTARRDRVRLAEVVDRLVPMLEQRLREVGMTLSVRVDDGARDARVWTDVDAVGQVLFNLVDNAAKYASHAADARVELVAQSRGEVVALTICDHGPGIGADYREAVFVPFDRGAVPGGSNDIPGVGLGLALARGLARDLGGDLRLRANPGGGACFVLELPLG